MSGKMAAHPAWVAAGLSRIPPHECRHACASFLMAAGCALKEIMECVGHSDLHMV
jgi:site-specific recombinase XerD